VTLKGPDGDVVTVLALDPKKLNKAAVGDPVTITHTEAVAILVEEPEKYMRSEGWIHQLLMRGERRAT
jgi:hypothetical protein